MKIQELHKAVLTALCQGSADSVLMVKFNEDDHIDATFNFEGESSYARLEDLSALLVRYGLIIGKIYFGGSTTEVHVVSWIPDCRFKTAIAEACSIFDLYTEDDQTIKAENVESIGRIIACAMKHKIL